MALPEKKSLSDFSVPIETIKKTFYELMKDKCQIRDLIPIFDIAVTDLSLFPNINRAASYTDYLERWIKGYEDASANIPSKRIAVPKSSCSDPAVKTIVKYATGVDDETLEIQNSHHNLFMSAENVQGNLLEEYINSAIHSLGWYWCVGNVLRAVDFCTPNGSVFLQIKNKSNTENSSSSAIRSGTSIKKWYRLGTVTIKKVKYPVYKWENLNSIINTYSSDSSKKCEMSENAYQQFLIEAATKNRNIITNQ